MESSTNKYHKLFIVIYLFALIYYPPIISTNLLHITTILGYIYLLINRGKFKKLIQRGHLEVATISLFLLGLYITLVSLASNSNLNCAMMYFQFVFEIIPCAVVVVIDCEKNHYSLDDFADLLLLVGEIQGILSVIAFIFPQFQTYTIQKAIAYGFNAQKYTSFLNRRYYGLAYNLVTYTPLVQSSLFIYSLQKAITKKTKYVLYLPLLLFSAVINARTPIIMIVIGLIIIFFSGAKRFSNWKLIPIIIAIVFIANKFYQSLETTSYRTYIWISQGFEEITSWFADDNTSGVYLSSITNWNKLIPAGFNFIFGTGETSIGGNKYGIASDVGYINYMWIGGFIFLVLVMVVFISMHTAIIRNIKEDKAFYVLALHLLVTAVIFNFKMPIYLLDDYSILIVLIFVFTQNEYYRRGEIKV